MITLQTADSILKSVYLDVIIDQINTKTNPFYNAIKKGDENVVGKEVICPTRYGINGGMGSAPETGMLPKSSGNNYISLRADLKNIYGTIELSDKALRSSESKAGSLVNVLNAEMEGLLEAAKFNFDRMLFQNGSGTLTTVGDMTGQTGKIYPVTSYNCLMEGMVVDVLSADGTVKENAVRIDGIDRATSKISLNRTVTGLVAGDILTLQQSYNTEICGLEYLFDDLPQYYGNTRSALSYMMANKTAVNAAILGDTLNTHIDAIEERSGSTVNMILASLDTRRKYVKNIQTKSTNVEYMQIDGGYTTVAINGIPIIGNRFVEAGGAYLLSTDGFKLQQLCDWQWLEGDNGSVLKQMESRPTYTATLVKYANLICTRPMAQAKLTGLK